MIPQKEVFQVGSTNQMQEKQLNHNNNNQLQQEQQQYDKYLIDNRQKIQLLKQSTQLQQTMSHLILQNKNISLNQLSQAISLCKNFKQLTIAAKFTMEQIKQLFQIIQNKQQLITLKLEYYTIDEENTQVMGQSIQNLNLKNISIFGLETYEFDIYEIYGQAVLSNKHILTIYFDLAYCVQKLGNNFWYNLDYSIQKKWSKLFKRKLKKLFLTTFVLYHTELELEFGKKNIGNKEASEIAKNIRKCSKLTKLKLILYENEISEYGAIGLGIGFLQLINLTNLELNLRENSIGPKGAAQIASSLSYLSQLKALTMNLNKTQIGDEGTSKIGEAIAKNQNIAVLELSLADNSIFSEGIFNLSEGIKNSKCLTKLYLYLYKNRFNQSDCQNLINKIGNNKKIIELIIYINSNLRSLEEKEKLNRQAFKISRIVKFNCQF
ncbi:hypothetical protein ABPG74_017821 [Tetrahymena malaccensis]